MLQLRPSVLCQCLHFANSGGRGLELGLEVDNPLVRGVGITTAALLAVIAIILLLERCEHGGTTGAALATATARRAPSAATVPSLQLWLDLNKRHANLAPGGRRKPPRVAGRWRAVGNIPAPHSLLGVVQ
jgi:hypothetical protein